MQTSKSCKYITYTVYTCLVTPSNVTANDNYLLPYRLTGRLVDIKSCFTSCTGGVEITPLEFEVGYKNIRIPG